MRALVFVSMIISMWVSVPADLFAQFPESIEAQRELMRQRLEPKVQTEEAAEQEPEIAKEVKENIRSIEVKRNQDPRPTRDTRSVKPTTPKPTSNKDPRPTSAKDAYPPLDRAQASKEKGAACSIASARDCSEELAAANRTCGDVAKRCGRTVSSTEDQSCAVMRCDITKAECMKDALDGYIACVGDVLDGAEAK